MGKRRARPAIGLRRGTWWVRRLPFMPGNEFERDYCEDFGYLPEEIPRGFVVCYARLSGAAQVGEIDPLGYVKFRRQSIGDFPAVVKVDKFGDYSPGRWLWFLEDVQKLPVPLQSRGSQGIWEFHQ